MSEAWQSLGWWGELPTSWAVCGRESTPPPEPVLQSHVLPPHLTSTVLFGQFALCLCPCPSPPWEWGTAIALCSQASVFSDPPQGWADGISRTLDRELDGGTLGEGRGQLAISLSPRRPSISSQVDQAGWRVERVVNYEHTCALQEF